MTTAYVTHPLYTGHDLPNHPERPARVKAVWRALDESGVAQRMKRLTPYALGDEAILAVHTRQYVELLHLCANHDHGMRFDADTLALPETPEIARLSAGGVVAAVDAIMTGAVDNALSVTRPPGHHAIPQRAMGFCFLSNVAIAARHAQRTYGIRRVMIVDYDVHHGNGTQDAFYDDKDVLFISTHQYPYYPGSGAVAETGAGPGLGATINIPLTAGHGDRCYAEIYRQVVWPAARRFKPELIIVSAGFDAHWDDPLAMMNLTLRGYDHLTRELIRMARELTQGRILFALEGGYDLTVLANGVLNVAYALLDDPTVSDPLGGKKEYEVDIRDLLDYVRKAHDL